MLSDLNETPPAVAADRLRLSVKGVSAGYGGAVIVQDVSLDVPDGALTVLVGPNGCGESTLLKAMARVLPVSAGRVLLDGASVHGTPTRDVA